MGRGGRSWDSGIVEGAERVWTVPARGDDNWPKCVVKVDFLRHSKGDIRGDLDAIAFCEYAVGGNTGPRGSAAPTGGVSKGADNGPVMMFTSLEKQDADFAMRWLRGDPALGGHDRTRWTVGQAWCVHLMRRTMLARKYRRNPLETHHFRIRLCPEPAAGNVVDMEKVSRDFMAAVESDYGGRFCWVGAVHYRSRIEKLIDTPHAHLTARGVDLAGGHVFFSSKYLRPSAAELKKDPAASSPIEWRARGILAAAMPATGVQRAG